jgi:hypothetical protein
MNETMTPTGLTAEQIQSFEDQGFLLLRGVLPPSALEPIKGVFEKTVDEQANQWFAEGKIHDKCENLSFETRYAGLREQLPHTFSNSWKRILVSRELYELWQQPELIALMRSLIGDEIYAHGTWNGRPRAPKQPVATIDWHQDAHYYPHFEMTDQPLISVWMPLVPVDETAGCLQVIPQSHKLGPLRAVRLPRNNLVGVADEDIDHLTPYSCIMEPGDVLLFQALTVHRALENNADYVRWSIDIRYCDASNEQAVSKAGRGYYCFSTSDPSRVQSFETWAAQYDYEGEF